MSRSLADWLRDAYADPAAGCPPPEAFLTHEAALMSAKQRQALEAHVERCPACRAERELARAFDEGEAGAAAEHVEWVVARLRGTADAAPLRAAAATAAPHSDSGAAATAGKPAGATQPGRRVVAPHRRRFAPAWTWLAAAAALIVVVAGLALFTVDDRSPTSPEPPRGRVARSGEVDVEVEVEAPLGEVAAPPRELRWRPVEGAAGYRVRLIAADETPLWDDRVTAPPAVIPPAVVARLHPAVSYDWGVEAMAPDGSLLARSATARFRIRALPQPPTATEGSASRPREDGGGTAG